MTATRQRRSSAREERRDRLRAPSLGQGEPEGRTRLLERDDPAVGPLLHPEDVDPVSRREDRA